jgi:hypothetical protein
MSQINSYAESNKDSLCNDFHGFDLSLLAQAGARRKSEAGGHLPGSLNI